MYKYILTLIKYIYSLVEAARYCFKGYINTMTLKAGFKQWKTDPCILWRVNKLETVIVIVYVYDTLEIGYKPALMDTIECINK